MVPVHMVQTVDFERSPSLGFSSVSKTSPRLGRTPEDSGGLERTCNNVEAVGLRHLTAHQMAGNSGAEHLDCLATSANQT